MKPDILDELVLDDPSCSLKQIHVESPYSSSGSKDFSYEMVSAQGVVVGYVKTWQDDDGFKGFVHFDPEGKVLHWSSGKRVTTH